ncbi:MAG TPA: SDR family oxidoreductase [Polyangiaceae bacterium]|nr:SDR family oxidoreductase [Polyangiaceae bacterium]
MAHSPSRTFLVTGANRGIGLELTAQLAARGDRVIAACRETTPELDALAGDAGEGRDAVRVERGVEVTSDVSVAELAGRLAGVSLDVLVLNAGILVADTLETLDFEGARRQFEVNALGPLRVAKALLPNLHEGSKIAIVTSRMGSIADNGSGRMYGYRMSKAAVNIAGASLARDLHPRGIAVALLHPGMVATEMTGGHGVPPADAARGLLARIDELDLAATGAFRHANGEPLPW